MSTTSRQHRRADGRRRGRTLGPSPIAETPFYPLATCASIAHASAGGRPGTRDALGRQTDYAYNSRGQLTEQTDPADAAGVRRRTSIDYAPVAAPGSAAGGVVTDLRRGDDLRHQRRRSAPNMNIGATPAWSTLERRIDAPTGATLETTLQLRRRGPAALDRRAAAGTDDTSYNRYDAVGRQTGRSRPIADGAARQSVLAVRNSYASRRAAEQGRDRHARRTCSRDGCPPTGRAHVDRRRRDAYRRNRGSARRCGEGGADRSARSPNIATTIAAGSTAGASG